MSRALRAAVAAAISSLVAALVVLVPSTGATAAPGDIPKRFGISYGERLTRMSPADLAETLDDAVAVGVKWIRIDFSWTTIQPKDRTTYSWDGPDRVVAAARARGLKVLPILTWTPAWARDAGCDRFTCPPKRPKAFATFAKAAVTRYKGRGVKVWEIWNEPNLAMFWPSPNPRRYATLLKTTAMTIRSVDKKAMVLLGGLAALENRPPSIGPRQFLRGVCKAGGCAAMNAVSYHPYTYPFPASRYSTGSAWSKISQTDWSLRGILANFGFPGKRIWVTEYGAPTQGDGTAADGTVLSLLPTTDHVNEAWQAVLATDVVTQAVQNDKVTALFWYTNQDLPITHRREASFGLRRLDGSAKPSWLSFQTAVRTASLG